MPTSCLCKTTTLQIACIKELKEIEDKFQKTKKLKQHRIYARETHSNQSKPQFIDLSLMTNYKKILCNDETSESQMQIYVTNK